MKIDTTKNISLYVFDYADYEYAIYFNVHRFASTSKVLPFTHICVMFN